MTQLFGGSSSSSGSHPHDRKMGLATPPRGQAPSSSSSSHLSPAALSSSSSHMASKLRSFFRISSSSSSSAGIGLDHRNTLLPPTSLGRSKSRFLRGRSTSSASQLDHAADMSPTANANPYFAHQGPPALRHYNNDSAPSSPPHTPQAGSHTADSRGGGGGGGGGGSSDKMTEAGKAELARKLRRVASAPNAQGLFKGQKAPGTPGAEAGGPGADRDVPDMPPVPSAGSSSAGSLLSVPADPAVERLRSQAFRRTYSSNSIKVRNVEVGPASFDKIKLLGKGDVGKVYLVREKKSSRLYAMKGVAPPLSLSLSLSLLKN